jgi:hypothetical protein
MKISALVLLLCVSIFFSNQQNAFAQSQQLPAFPGAEGFGSTTVGGRDGQVIKVTNLQDAGSGSLRAALEDVSGPRIVVFDVYGTIDLSKNIVVRNPYLTIAGQTSPGIGITLRNASIDVETHDVIVRGMKFRVGDNEQGQDPNSRDGFSISAPWMEPGTSTYNVIVDHNDIAWGVDENTQVWGNDDSSAVDTVKNITYSWNMIYEALGDSAIYPQNNHASMGSLFGGNNSNLSVHHNLYAHHLDRNPRIAGVKNVEMVNNLIYNWGTPTRIDYASSANIVNNYYIPGATSSNREIKFDNSLDYSQSKFYIAGNTVDSPDRSLSNTSVRSPANDPSAIILQQNNGDVLDWYTNSPPVFKSETPVFNPTFQPNPVSDVYNLVLDYAGAQNRDVVSNRVINSVKNRTGTTIDSVAEVGGWPVSTQVYETPVDSDNDGMPDSWELQFGLEVSNNDSAEDPDGDGYTNIEEYINSLITVPGYSSGDPVSEVEQSPTQSPSPITEPSPTTEPATCNEDINVDGEIDIIDYSIMQNDFFKSSPGNPRSDINRDSRVNLFDYTMLSKRFFEEC